MYLLETSNLRQTRLSNEFLSLFKNLQKTELRGASSKFKEINESLDKYYTKESIAKDCYEHLKLVIQSLGIQLDQVVFVEPSAGSGAFLKQIKEQSIGFDIAPASSEIIKNDFLTQDLRAHLPTGKKIIFIGNPPFGKKSSLAIEFINKALSYSNVVGFIVPIQFRKWSAQSKIDADARLVFDMSLPENAFEIVGKDYNLRCCFQVWATDVDSGSDLRIKEKPSTSHKDFEIYQYNRTEQAEKFFDYEWDFAVPRQGFQDYTVKVFTKDDCDKKQQWIFFKAKNKTVLKRLLSLDFVKLSKKNIGTPGFGKADVVNEYVEKYEMKTPKK